MAVDHPEIESRVEADEAGTGMSQDELAHLIGVDHGAGRIAGTGRRQGQPRDAPVAGLKDLGLRIEGQIASVREGPAVPGPLIGEFLISDPDAAGRTRGDAQECLLIEWFPPAVVMPGTSRPGRRQASGASQVGARVRGRDSTPARLQLGRVGSSWARNPT